MTVAGRHVTGSMRIDETNPLGRKTCPINYTRRPYWTGAQERIALQVASHQNGTSVTDPSLGAIRNARGRVEG